MNDTHRRANRGGRRSVSDDCIQAVVFAILILTAGFLAAFLNDAVRDTVTFFESLVTNR